jgi:tetratricopeptide (TPR) repeat protein
MPLQMQAAKSELQAAKSELTELNNAGSLYISNGQFADAIRCFTSGLRIARNMIQSEQNNCDESLPTTTDDDAGYQADQWMTIELEIGGGDVEAAEFFYQVQALNCMSDRQDLVYRKPIVLAEDDASSYTLNAYSFLTVFNLALAHHLDALSKEVTSEITSDSSCCQFQAALSLYELAYSLQMQDDACVTALHACAIINNIGQVQRKLKNDEIAERCFEHLLSMLMVVIGSGEGNHHDDVCRSFAPFFHTVQPFILKTAASAPAA